MIDTVSVALPVYNGALYLAEQLDSILQQLEAKDEIIAAYQPSEDGSLSILKAYHAKDPRVKILYNQGSGITSNFDQAISHCAGDVIFLSDQDDVWLPNKRRVVVDAFARTGADLIIHNAVHTNAQLQRQEQTFFDIYPIGPGKWKNIKRPRMSGCCMAFTQSMRDKLLPIPEIYGYDQWIAVLAEFSGKIEYLEDVLLLHRLHGENSTTSTRSLSVILRCRTKLLYSLIFRLCRIRFRGT